MKSEFGNNIATIRKENGWSQKETAKKLGVSQALLSHYEKGIRECGLEFLVKATKVFNCSADYLLGLSESAQPITDIDNISADLNRIPKLDKSRNDVINTLNLLYSITARIGNPEICKDFNKIVSSNIFLMINMFENHYFSKDMFENEAILRFSNAKKVNANAVLSFVSKLSEQDIYLNITNEQLEKEYPITSASLSYILKKYQ